MSGIYIPGMEMPTSCAECVFKSVTGVDRWKCHALKAEFMSWSVGWGGEETRRIDCPPIPVPEHGRLIDADALIAWFEEWYDPNADLEICHVVDILDDNSVTPTIIPADKEAEK